MNNSSISAYSCQQKKENGTTQGDCVTPDGGEFSLPCLYSNNSTEDIIGTSEYSLISALQNVLSSYHKRQAETLHLNVARLIESAPSINHVGFLTLTFKDNVTDHKEAYKRFRSFNSHFLSPSEDFGEWICVKEPQKRGAWHYHLLVVLKHDIRSGFDFSAVDRKDYSSSSPHLRKLWSMLRTSLPKYGFGRSELLPIKSNVDAMAYYLGKYIGKAICARSDSQKGVRLVSYSKGWSKNSVHFQWHTDNSKLWRRKLNLFSAMMGCSDFYELNSRLGSGWAYRYADTIISLPDEISDSLIARYQFVSIEWKPLQQNKADLYSSLIINSMEAINGKPSKSLRNWQMP